jgi:hypothetical protein
MEMDLMQRGSMVARQWSLLGRGVLLAFSTTILAMVATMTMSATSASRTVSNPRDDAAAHTGAQDQISTSDAEQEIGLGKGDMPAAYRCPISAYIMLDPMILPSSGLTVDRKSIAD